MHARTEGVTNMRNQTEVGFGFTQFSVIENQFRKTAT